MRSYNGSAMIVIAAAATTAGAIALTSTYDVITYAKNDQFDGTQVRQLELYETPFDRVEYGEYDNAGKLDVINKFVSTLTKDSSPLSVEDNRLISDSLFDLM